MNITIRIDDIGASTKQFEVYSKNRIGNILFLKYIEPFKAWGPYPEISSEVWERVFVLLNEYNARLTVGVTATWVEKNSSLVPFPEKFPSQAALLKQAWEKELIEIANHGLTHCVVGKHLPRLFLSNRKYHREFWDWIPRDIHFEHLEKSQEIFRQWLGKPPTTLIPPGNVYSVNTLEAAEKYGIHQINSYMNHGVESNVRIISNDAVDAIHDRDLLIEGVDWLSRKLKANEDIVTYSFVKDL